MSILITGGSGLIGASLMQMIVELGERPTIFDIAPIHPILRKIDSKFKYFQGSLDHLPELLNIIKTEAIDTVFHLGGMLSIPSEKKPWASFLTPPYSAKEPAEVVRSRIPGVHLTFKPDSTLMELIKEIGILRFNEERARSEWGWKTSYSLPQRVDDVIEEFSQGRSLYL